MKEVAEAMHCRFVYAIVPAGGKDESIEMIIEQQAETIAVKNLDIFKQQLSTH